MALTGPAGNGLNLTPPPFAFTANCELQSETHETKLENRCVSAASCVQIECFSDDSTTYRVSQKTHSWFLFSSKLQCVPFACNRISFKPRSRFCLGLYTSDVLSAPLLLKLLVANNIFAHNLSRFHKTAALTCSKRVKDPVTRGNLLHSPCAQQKEALPSRHGHGFLASPCLQQGAKCYPLTSATGSLSFWIQSTTRPTMGGK